MPKDREIIYEPHPVTPERKAELRAAGFKIIDAQYAPEGAHVGEPLDPGLGTDSGDQFADDELRKIIERETGQKPHHNTGRAKLVEQFNALNAAASGEGSE